MRTVIVCLGDSLTAGVGSTPDAHHTWPDFLAARLVAERGSGNTFAVVNQGYSGNRLLRDGCGESALARFDRDVLAQAGVTDVIVFEGINDLAGAAFGEREDASPQEIVSAYRQMIRRAHDAGLRIHGATLTPFGGSAAYTPDGEAARAEVNAFVRSGGEFDGVFDFDAAVRDDAAPTRLSPRYDSGDHIHLTDAGYEALANAVDLLRLR
ncbi:MAG TPA: SGNH/GDSL hydrolase family protein [Anaeromyxobacteraceae bacterium]|nr:SGNH/GDSL hydrolase family protein [Anaeromyxobacteraceae bacterium]